MGSFKIRTDLALEARENAEEEAESLSGVSVEEVYHEDSEVRITKVSITSKNSARALGKPMGTYITLEAPAMTQQDENYHQEISGELSMQLREIIPELEKESSILVVGLGNRDVTADALGPNVVDNLTVTRHMVKEFGKAAYGKERMHVTSALIPGVMAKTGMESAEIIKGVVEKTKPDAVIVIDALAARSTRRLCRTIQLTDTGIQPGSGVGNHRAALTKETLGIPVIAIGVPTVVEAAAIIYDAQGNCEQMPPHLNGMFVTPKNIDELIKQLSFTLSEALNMVFAHGES